MIWKGKKHPKRKRKHGGCVDVCTIMENGRAGLRVEETTGSERESLSRWRSLSTLQEPPKPSSCYGSDPGGPSRTWTLVVAARSIGPPNPSAV